MDRPTLYVIHADEAHLTLPEYVAKIVEAEGSTLLDDNPPGEAGSSIRIPRLSLSTQSLVFLSTNLLYDVFDSGSCVSEFLDEILVFDLFGRPRLLGATFTEFSHEIGAKNVRGLAEIFLKIFNRKRARLPGEVLHLLVLMENLPFEMQHLIRFHPVTLPLENRGVLGSREYEYINEILKETDTVGYYEVRNGLAYPRGWPESMNSNFYLMQFYSNAPHPYDPDGLLDRAEDFKLEPLRFSRNCPSHALEYAARRREEHGTALTQFKLGHCLYHHLHGLLTSVGTALNRIGALKQLNLEYLWPWGAHPPAITIARHH